MARATAKEAVLHVTVARLENPSSAFLVIDSTASAHVGITTWNRGVFFIYVTRVVA